MCASTLCPFSSSTRNIAFGSGSVTVPSTRIMSSLGLTRASHHLEQNGDRAMTFPRLRNRVRSRENGGWTEGRAERAFGRPVRIPDQTLKRQAAPKRRAELHTGREPDSCERRHVEGRVRDHRGGDA